MESWLAARPEEAQRIAEYRRLGEALRAAYGHLVDDAVPARLERAVQAAPRRSFARFIGGLALGAVLGAAVAWQLRGWPPAAELVLGPGATMVHNAAVAHAVYSLEVRHPVEVGAQEQSHLVAWLSKRLGMKVEAPDLKAAGMALVGGRLLPGEDRPVAMLMYETAEGRRATLYWAPDTTRARETELLYTEARRVRVFYWIDRECGYAVASAELSKDELARVAQIAHEQLEK
jgi:anti-sigma factor RsiW